MKLSPNWLHSPQTQKLLAAFSGEKIRFVGGAVRDAVLGIEAADIDLATIIPPLEVMELLEKSGIRTIPTGLAHGTITAIIDGKSFEITTLRRDTFCDGRHAEVEFGTDWVEDARRRDFTMNAMYLAADGELFDYFGGLEDALAGRVHFIGDAKQRIQEDYLRILRFFRFFAVYGKGEPDMHALNACTEFASNISTLSGERIQAEMLKLLAALTPFYALELMQNTGVFVQVFGFDCHLISNSRPRNKCGVTNLALLLLSADISPQDALNKITKRWKISNDLQKKLGILINNINNISPEISIAKQKQIIRKLEGKNFAELVQLKNALSPHENYQKMLELAQNWQTPTLPINGDDLIALGIPAGKSLGEKLRKLEKIWEESDYKVNREELLTGEYI